jgi:uncharacterized protein (DUF2267 family)
MESENTGQTREALAKECAELERRISSIQRSIGQVKEKSFEQARFEVVYATHANVSVEEFDGRVRNWLKTDRHPRFNRPYTDLARFALNGAFIPYWINKL